MNWEWMWKEVLTVSRYNPGIFLERPRKTTKNLSQDKKSYN
jgi:hypothetical protein